MASALGRTCSTMAFRFSDLARSRMTMASACCFSALRLLRLGQSIFDTVDTHTARNSRGAGGGWLLADGAAPGDAGVAAGIIGVSGVLLQALNNAASPPAAQAARVCRFFALKTKTTPRYS